jgi:hypothetical protein
MYEFMYLCVYIYIREAMRISEAEVEINHACLFMICIYDIEYRLTRNCNFVV